MRKILLTICCVLCLTAANAQTTTTISSGTNTLNVGATFNVPAGFFVNNGSYTDTTSPGAFNVNGGVVFSGSGTTTVYNLNFNSGASLLNSLVTVYGTVTVGAGDSLDANNNLMLHKGANLVVNGYIVNNALGLVTNASATTGACPSYTSNLSTNVSGSVILYQWQSSTDSATWTPVAGATSATYTATVTATTYYRANITTTNSTFAESTPGVKLLFTGVVPAAITGTPILCVGSTTALSDATPGGTWSSSATGVATVGSTGIVTGVSGGTATITYDNSCTPAATFTVTVSALPTSITGTAVICSGLTTTLNGTPAGGSWSNSDNTIATIDPTTGIVSAIAAGTSRITYTLPAGCFITEVITVNLSPAPISGPSGVCASGGTITLGDAIGSGTWTSSSPAQATIGSSSGLVTGGTTGTTTITYTLSDGCTATSLITVNPLPGAITGTAAVCVSATTALTDAGGGTWASSNGAVATVGTGGIVTGVSAGTSTITYTLPTGCIATVPVTVNLNPAPIAGTLTVCSGLTTSLSDAIPGGTWISSAPAVASIDLASGLVTGGGTTGTTTITYTITGGCNIQAIVTVNPSPAAITGLGVLCAGSTTSLSDATAGGTWTSTNTAVATVGTSGTVTGITTGFSNITYALPTGCYAATVVGVDALPIVTSATGNTTCSGVSSSVSAVPPSGATINWFNNITAGSLLGTGNVLPVITPSVTTTYYAEAEDNNLSPLSTIFTGLITEPGVMFDVTILRSIALSSFDVRCNVGTFNVEIYYKTGTLVGSESNPAAWTLLTTIIGSSSGGVGNRNFPLPAPLSLISGQTYAFYITGTIPGGGEVVYGSGAAVGNILSSNADLQIKEGVAKDYPFTTTFSPRDANISINYTKPSCSSSPRTAATLVVNPVPGAITGTATVCTGFTTALADTPATGTWSSSNTAQATVSVSGVVLGVSAGTPTISYTLSGGCNATKVITVNASPTEYTVTGGGGYCTGGSGLIIGVSNSQVGVNYQLFFGVSPVGTPVGGTGTAITFPAQTTAGTYTVVGTNTTTSCATTMSGNATITINTPPTAFNVTGGGGYCTGGTGVAVGLNGSETGVNYQLILGGSTPVGSPAAGTGSAISFGLQATIGTYTVSAINVSTSCTVNMTGSVTVTVNPLPASFTVTGGGTYCTAGSGDSVGLTGSQNGVRYQLYVGATPTGSPVNGTGSAITFGLQTAGGSYSVRATDTTTGCTSNMSGTVTVTPIALPALHNVAGGGGYCAGGTGVHIFLDYSDVGINYQLYNGGVPVGLSVGGTNSGLDMGLETTAGTYTVSAANPTTTCTVNMTGSVTVTINPLPVAFNVTGGGGYCLGGPGVPVGLDSSQIGVNYQLYNGATLVGAPVAGTGAPLSFGLQTSAGIDSVVATNTATGCTRTMNSPVTVTVNPLPTAITGTRSACPGTTTTLNSTPAGGTWTSSNTSQATVDPSTGVVTGVAAGNPIITYTTAGTGCIATATITVNATPPAISGASSVCIGSTTALTDATGGGTWLSGTPSVATIGSTSGIVSGLTASTTLITYTAPTGCTVTKVVSVNSLPSSITGTLTVCTGSTTPLTDAGGGTWSSSNTLVATVGSTGIVTGVSAGTSNITYTLGTGCPAISVVTVNTTPGAITGTNNVCQGLTTTLSDGTSGGTWSSSSTTIASVGSTGIVTGGSSAGTATITYTVPSGCFAVLPVTVNALPPAIQFAPFSLCTGGVNDLFDFDGSGTGAWSSSNTAVATIVDIFDFSGDHISVISAVAAGTTTITYTSGTGGCIATVLYTVNQTPAAITGTTVVCSGLTTTLNDATAGGAWSSLSSAIASVGSTGIVTGGASAGTTTISYTMPTGCFATAAVTVNTTPSALTGTKTVCTGFSTALGSGPAGGTWSSNNTTLATVDGSGNVWGVSAGTPVISYTLGTGCTATSPVTVNPTPPAITGTKTVCTGLTTTLSDATSGGVWSSVTTGVATVVAGSGVVSGVASGTSTISYTIPATSCAVIAVVTVNTSPATITGTLNVCTGATTALGETTGGGTWSSSNTAQATVGTSGIVTGVAPGTPIISYTLGTGCTAAAAVTVNPTPPAITGSSNVCLGLTDPLSDAVSGGLWSSNNSNATVNSTSGLVTGSALGTSTISYVMPTGCLTTLPVTVNTQPAPITGASTVCTGVITNLTETTGGGSWSSSNTAFATVNASTGAVTGVFPGSLVITYTLGSCTANWPMTVNLTPAAIAGPTQVCIGTAITLTDASLVGSWSSGNTATATVGSLTGVVTGALGGPVNIIYTLPGGCTATYPITVNTLPTTITGTTVVCKLATTTLNSTPAGGTWSSGNTSLATVDPSTGVVTGVSAGTPTITYTIPTACIITTIVTVNPLPTLYTVTGGGSYCAGAGGVHVFLSGSDTGVRYQLYNGSATAGAPLSGTGSSLDFGPHLTTGTRKVVATNMTTGCLDTMNSSAFILVNPTPTAFFVTSTATSYCAGGSGVNVGLAGSNTGIRYQLYLGSTPLGSPVLGTGSALNFGTELLAGVYTVVATDTLTGCTNNMSGGVSISITPLPTVYSMTGGGGYCSGGAGADIGLNGSDINVNYQLFNGVIPGTIVAGTGSPIDFGFIPTAGTSYTAIATSLITGCSTTMSGTLTVSVNPLPTPFTVGGGGSYCAGGAGSVISLSGSTAGFSYQLYIGTTPIGSPVIGTGTGFNFPPQVAAGTYTVLATNPTTSCTNTMTGTATITINPLPAVSTLSMTGGGSYCTGGTGVPIGLSSSFVGTSYQLFRGTTLVTTMAGTGTSLAYPIQTIAATYTILASIPLTTCTVNVPGSVTVTITPLPAIYAMTGGGSYCTGGTGVPVGLSNSDIGINYQLKLSGIAVGAPVAGTGLPLNFGTFTGTGPYTVVASNALTTCTSNMSGTATVSTIALPTAFAMTGGGNYCAGGIGDSIGLSSSAIGVSYQLFNGGMIGSPIAGTGLPLSFGRQTIAGIYTVVGTNTTTFCTNNMLTSATITISPLPTAYPVAGGGSACNGGTGVDVSLSLSDAGISYQLFKGTTAIGTPISGTGGALDFGFQTVAGTYTIVATNTTTLCTSTMAGSAIVTINPLPFVHRVTGGGNFCAGGAGVHIGLSGSGTTISYQLYAATGAIGVPVTGIGTALDFGLIAVPGTYYVVATNSTTGCADTMSGSAVVSTSTAPAVYTITGGGSYCSGGGGVPVGLSSSESGVNYQLYDGTSPSGPSVAGIATLPISFGLRTAAGTYTIVATNATTSCTTNMAGTVSVSINPLPTAHSITGGGTYCAGSTGVDVALDGSDSGTNYQLFVGTIPTGTAVAGTGTALDMGMQTLSGVYTVVATNTGTGCSGTMTGSATVSINPQPTAYEVLGGGSYCTGLSGVDVSLGGSAIGVNYQLYRGTTPVGGTTTGTGLAIDFGLETAPGNYIVTATDATTACSDTMSGSASVTISPLPPLHTVTGGGSFCIGDTGVHVSLDGSNTGISYQLIRGTSPVGAARTGTGSPLDFGLQTVAGIYTVAATDAATACPDNMTGAVLVTVNPLPVAYAVNGGGSYCAGGTGVNVGLSGSTIGVNYQLYDDTSAVGSTMAGTGSAISFGLHTTAGTYTIVATSASTGCNSNMTDSALITINPLPTVHMVTGSGSYCAGSAGVDVGLNNSDTGISYQLFVGISATGSPVTGTGSSLDFGLQTVAGLYTVMATNATTACTMTMADSALITTSPLPVVYSVLGGGSYCAGGVGVDVSLSGSNVGVTYQVFRDTFAASAPTAGTGFPLDLAFETFAGTYTVIATNTATGCTSNMTGSASVSVNPPPSVYTVTGGGSYCAGSGGVHVVLSSSNSGINYQLFNGSTMVGGTMAGTGSPLDFGLLTTPGFYTVVATNATTGCTSNMTGSASISINPPPAVYTMLGGGSYCAGGTGVALGLSGSTAGISYQLYNGTAPAGTPVTGTGSAISFGSIIAAGTYTAIATDPATGCTMNMSSSSTVTVNSLPNVYAITGGGSYCEGGAGFHIGLSNSNTGINYQLYTGGSIPAGSAVAGMGAALDFGLQTAAGTYTVVASNAGTGCTDTMSGTSVITVNALPVVYLVTGGGSYCASGAGVPVGLSRANSGVSYQLYHDGSITGSPVAGTDTVLSFGLQTLAGTYKVVATNITTTCTSAMFDSAIVTITPTVTPGVTIVTGGDDTVCAGSSASFSALVVNGGASPAYQWYVNGTPTVATGTYSYAPADNDTISVTITSDAVCPLPATASNSVVMRVLDTVLPVVHITANPGDTICRGIAVTFSLTPAFGGTAPSYTWVLNGANVGTDPTFSYMPATGDVIFCGMISNYRCRTTDHVVSNNITMTVETADMPVVSITVNPGVTVDGVVYRDTLTAVVVNGGFTPSYQWMVNGVTVAGATNAMFVADSLSVNDLVACIVTNANACGTLVGSNSTVITVTNVGVKQVVSLTGDVKLVPNPNTGTFTVKGTLGTNSDEEVTLEVTDMLGQVIYKEVVIAHNGTINERIQLSNALANGMYMLNMSAPSGNKVFHMVIEQ